jgi:hypothetical protein
MRELKRYFLVSYKFKCVDGLDGYGDIQIFCHRKTPIEEIRQYIIDAAEKETAVNPIGKLFIVNIMKLNKDWTL